jgi:hypothetical protein
MGHSSNGEDAIALPCPIGSQELVPPGCSKKLQFPELIARGARLKDGSVTHSGVGRRAPIEFRSLRLGYPKRLGAPLILVEGIRA